MVVSQLVLVCFIFITQTFLATNVHGLIVYVCEHKSTLTIACPNNQLIRINSALYGRVERVAGGCKKTNVPSKTCIASTSLSKTQSICQNRRSCRLSAHNNIYGDPCQGTVKYLKVDYQCINPIRVEFETKPIVNDTIKIGGSISLLGCQYYDNTGKDYTGAWTNDGEMLTQGNVRISRVGTFRDQLGPLVFSKLSLNDEGFYRCALKQNGSVVHQSEPLQLLFDELVHVKFSINLKVVEMLASRKKRSLINDDYANIFDKVTNTLRNMILQNAPGATVRFIKNPPNKIDVFIAGMKQNNDSEVALFDNMKFLLSLKKVSGYELTIENNDYCPGESIGTQEYKGVYTYKTSKPGTVITKNCTHGSMNINKNSFTRECRTLESSSSPGWTTPDLLNCLAETKTTKALHDLENKPICSQTGQKNCIPVETAASNLSSIVSSSAVISIPEDVSLVSQIIEGISQNINTATTAKQAQEVVTDVLLVTSEVSEASPEVVTVAEKTTQASNNIRNSLEVIAQRSVTLLTPGAEIKASSKNIGFVATKVNRKNIQIVSRISNANTLTASFDENSTISESEVLALMNVPESALPQQTNINIYSFTFRNDALFKSNNKVEAGTTLLSATINNKKIQNLQTPINVTFKIVDSSILNRNPNCSFWDETKNAWSTSGLTKGGTTSQSYLCQTNHLTNFALIIDVSQKQSNPLALQYITWIGCGISLGGLSLTVFSNCFFKKLRSKLVPRLLICLSLSLMCTMLIFLFGVEKTGSKVGCQVIAALLHYFLLVSFSWMAVQGYKLYRILFKTLKRDFSEFQFFVRSFLGCTGIPAIVVIITASVRSDDYGGENLCLVTGIPFYAALLAPIALVIATNIIFLVLVLNELRKNHQRTKSMKTDNNDGGVLKMAKITISCSILLGMTWVFGVLAVGELTLVFQYLFCIFNSLQGFFIFLFYTLTNTEVRKEWKKAVGWETFSTTFSQTTKKSKMFSSNATRAKKEINPSTSSSMGNGRPTSASSSIAEENRYSNPVPYRSTNLNVSRGIANSGYNVS